MAHKHKCFSLANGASALHTKRYFAHQPFYVKHIASNLMHRLELLYTRNFYFTCGVSTLHAALLRYMGTFYFTCEASTLHAALLLYMHSVYFTCGSSTLHVHFTSINVLKLLFYESIWNYKTSNISKTVGCRAKRTTMWTLRVYRYVYMVLLTVKCSKSAWSQSDHICLT